MRVLCIGNSFSQDATRYLHDIAKADGERLEAVNLYIGGCSLETHHQNMKRGDRAYELQYDGHMTGFFLSLDEALNSRPWDVITMQQVSTQSFEPDSFRPYIGELAEYVGSLQPQAKLVLHQTWAYEAGSQRLQEVGYLTPQQMTEDIIKAYEEIGAEIGAAGILPSGRLAQKLLEMGLGQFHRDTFHATLGAGRYALGLLWYRMLTGNTVSGNGFSAFDREIATEEQAFIQSVVDGFQPLKLSKQTAFDP